MILRNARCNEILLLLLLHGSTVLVGPWPPSSRLFCVHVSSSLWHPSSSGPPSHRPSTVTLVFLHSYFLLECSDITSLPPFPHSSSPHIPAISIFLFILFLLLCPILHIIASLLHLFFSSSPHIGPATSFPKYAKFFSSFAVKHRASEPHITTGLIIVLYIPIFGNDEVTWGILTFRHLMSTIVVVPHR